MTYLSPSTYYYSLTNINDFDESNSIDQFDPSTNVSLLKKSTSDSMIYEKRLIETRNSYDASEESIEFDSSLGFDEDPLNLFEIEFESLLKSVDRSTLDSDTDDLINESEEISSQTDHSLFPTCQTTIFDLLLHSTDNRQTIEQLRMYLSNWYDMRDRTRARHLLHISQEIIRLKLRLDDEHSLVERLVDFSCSPSRLSLIDLKQQIFHRMNLNHQHRQKLDSFHEDLRLADQHLHQYSLTDPYGPSASNLDEYLETSRIHLDKLTEKMDSYQFELQSLLHLIDTLLPMEHEIEEKISNIEDQYDLSDLQTLIDNYHRILPENCNHPLVFTVKTHCECKLEFYRKLFDELTAKHQRHVTFDASSNFNNNNSSMIQTSTPQDHFNLDEKRKACMFVDHAQRGDQLSNTRQEQQSLTTSYISDDCKVLYIETVIEVTKPVFYERTNNIEHYYHSTANHFQNQQRLTMSDHDSSCDEYDNKQPSQNCSASTSNHDHSKQQGDSGIELDKTSSSSTIFNQKTPATLSNQGRSCFVPNEILSTDQPAETSLLRRFRQTETAKLVIPQTQPLPPRSPCPKPIERKSLISRCFAALFLGLFMLFIVFVIYLYNLDRCSRSLLFHMLKNTIIRVERQGIPLI